MCCGYFEVQVGVSNFFRLLLYAVCDHVAELGLNNHLDLRMSLGGPSLQNLMAGGFETGASALPSYLYIAAFERRFLES